MPKASLTLWISNDCAAAASSPIWTHSAPTRCAITWYRVAAPGVDSGVDPRLYVRRNRELVGDGECIMGLADFYPASSVVHGACPSTDRASSRRLALASSRIARTVCEESMEIFIPGIFSSIRTADSRVLDRSRGEYGDPADDLTCITLNYAFLLAAAQWEVGRRFREPLS